ncbi:hypothetical protein HOLleu_19310 [Holothuria leucospilota]|uniref:HYR domain-containing protein n=1 Tax=Holothuria leucospilota TaxID=206669 RepID=A0A9Q1BZV2_HOLLE|nr:hypothetical protein HOLleu_19310 [Holothuria leucospilota]
MMKSVQVLLLVLVLFAAFVYTAVNIPPVVTCPPPVSVETLAIIDGNFVSWDDPVCIDANQPGTNLDLTCEPASGTFFQGLGRTVVTCTCRDNQEATDTCTITITVIGGGGV